jgi:hypothetical protein
MGENRDRTPPLPTPEDEDSWEQIETVGGEDVKVVKTAFIWRTRFRELMPGRLIAKKIKFTRVPCFVRAGAQALPLYTTAFWGL